MVRYRIVYVAISSLGALVLLGLSFLLLSNPPTYLAASRAVIVVDTLADESNNDGDCSLREAIQAASTNTPVDACPAGSVLTDTISFAGKGTIPLDDQLLVQTGNALVIDGGETITISGNSSVRIFTIYAGAELTLRNLSLVDGYNGSLVGGIYNLGSLFIENSVLSRNYTGAIYNSGTLQVMDSTFSDNSASIRGGAIYNSGTLRVIDSTFSDNSASTGGGIYDFARGGGIYNSAGSTLDVSNTHFIRNDAEDEGGGIFNAGQAEIRGSSFSGAHSSMGSGISTGWSETSSLIISDSVIYENHAVDSGGDFSGIGAGIMYWSGVMTITNTTISANYAEREGGGIGGYHQGASSVMFIHSTIFGNSMSGWGGGSNIYFNGSGTTLTFRNSIIAGGVGGDNCVMWLGGTIIQDDGFNIEDANTCSFYIANGSMPDTPPLLGPLQDNGGPIWTHAPLPGSPAIDAAKPEYCPPADQRGVARPVDGDGDGEAICDIGSYEFRQATVTTIISDQPDPSTAGEPFLVAFGVTTTVGVPTGNVIVDGGNGTCSGELVDGSGTCEITILESGTYTLTASYSGNATYEFSHDTEVHEVLSSGVKVYLPIINRP